MIKGKFAVDITQRVQVLYPIHEVSCSDNLYPFYFLGPETFNVWYLDPLNNLGLRFKAS